MRVASVRDGTVPSPQIVISLIVAQRVSTPIVFRLVRRSFSKRPAESWFSRRRACSRAFHSGTHAPVDEDGARIFSLRLARYAALRTSPWLSLPRCSV